MKLLQKCALAAVLCAALSAQAGELTVSAAASLKDAFQEINQAYKQQNADTEIHLNTAGSGTLLQQLLQGAPVDVLATADEKTMNDAAAKNAIDTAGRHTFVKNDLVLITPKNSTLKIENINGLLQKDVKRIALSNPDSVPVGRYSKAALEKAGLYAQIQPKVITTQNVRQSLDYVARGEVDAGFVYRTDAILEKGKVDIRATVPLETPVTYPIAVTSASKNKAEAQKYVDFVRSDAGRAILDKYGFSRP